MAKDLYLTQLLAAIQPTRQASLALCSLKARLSKTEGDEAGLKAIRSNAVMNTTVFLGKMISRKDKYGLIRGSDMAGEEEDSSRDNPLIAALEKVKLRQQSLDSDSRAASRTSHVR